MRDVNRLRILQDVIDRNLRPGLAAEMLGITPRHCSRLLKRYRQSGPLGMNNQSRGRTGNRLLSASLTDQALNIIRERYADFGPTLTWEKCRLLVKKTHNTIQWRMLVPFIPVQYPVTYRIAGNKEGTPNEVCESGS
ncbi:helix-turn-helix domain-containing protein [Klebsiella pneumoniae]|nr:helix-turn-helix domain-containing protein [Klebsiella pneumoniae]